jgi:hypothetical protein
MLFWPVVIALGPGFVALYYDHDVKYFADQNVCEQTLPEVGERANRSEEFITALTEAADGQMSKVVFRMACIDKTPQEFQQQLDDLSGKQAKT